MTRRHGPEAGPGRSLDPDRPGAADEPDRDLAIRPSELDLDPLHAARQLEAAEGRSLFNGQWGDPEIAIGVGITAILAVISVWIAARMFARANA